MNNLTKATLMTTLWLFNPIIGCSEGKQFEFEEADMVELMDTVSQETWSFEQNDVAYDLSFSLEQGDVVYDEDGVPVNEEAVGALMPTTYMSSAHACGTRSFAAEASACVDISLLSVTGSVIIKNAETQEIVIEEAVDGSIEVIGTKLNNAALELQGESSDFDFRSQNGLSFELEEASW